MSRVRKIVVFVLSIFLLSGVLAACGDGKVKVKNIAFSDSVIELVVDQEIEPEVIFTPTYATNRRYTLSSSNKQVLRVDGNKIKGLVSGTAILTAKSASESKSASVTVRVFEMPVQLPVPTNLSFNGTHVRFDAMQYGNGIPVGDYQIKINNQTFDMGSRTFYSNITSDIVNTVFVRSVGNTTATLSSSWSAGIEFIKIGKVSNVSVTDKILTFDAVPRVQIYKVALKLPNDTVKIFETAETSFDLSAQMTLPGNYSVTVQAVKTGYDLSSVANIAADQIFNSEVSAAVNFSKLETPANFKMNNNRLEWNNIASQCTYSVRVYNAGYSSTFDNITNNYFELPLSLASGEYLAALVAKNSNGNVYSSDLTDAVQFKKLATPVIAIENNIISWSAVGSATGYLLYLNETVIDLGAVRDYRLQGAGFAAGDYKVAVAAYGNNESTCKSNVLDSELRPVVTKLDKASLLTMNNYKLSWLNVTDAVSYDVYLNNEKQNAEPLTESEFLFDKENFLEGDNQIKVKAIGNRNEIFDADDSAPCQVTRLAQTENVRIEDETVKYNTVSNAVSYLIEVLSGSEVILSADNTINLNLLDAGDYNVRVTAAGDEAYVIDGEKSAAFAFKKLQVPELTITKNIMHWSDLTMDGAQNYTVEFENSASVKQKFGNVTLNSFEIDSAIAADTYSITVKAVGNGSSVLSSKTQAMPLIVKKLESVGSLSFDSSSFELTFTNDYDANMVKNFEIMDVTEGLSVGNAAVSGNSFAFEQTYFNNAGNYRFAVIAVAVDETVDNMHIISSDLQANNFIDIQKLGMISNLHIEDNILKFNASDNFNAMLIINGEDKIELSNVNNVYSYNLTQDEGSLFVAAGAYAINARLIGSGANIIDGNSLPGAMNVSKLSAPLNLRQDGDTIIFSEAENASKYKMQIDETVYDIINITPADGQFELDIYSTQLSDKSATYLISELLSAGNHNIKVLAKGNYLSTIDSSFTEALPTLRLAAPVLSLNNSVLSFAEIENAITYALKFTYLVGESAQTKEYLLTELNYDINLDNILEGEVKASVRVFGGNNVFSSEFGNIIKFIRKQTPSMFVQDGVLRWSGDANVYLLKVGANNYTKDKDGWFDFAGYGSSVDMEFVPTLQAMATEYTDAPNAEGKYFVNSKIISKTVIKLATPELTTLNGKFSYYVSNSANFYSLELVCESGDRVTADNLYTDSDKGQRKTVVLNSLVADKADKANLRAKYYSQTDSNVIYSDLSTINVKMLKSPLNVRLENGYILWSGVTNASGYEIYITNISTQQVLVDYTFTTSSTSLKFPLPGEIEWSDGIYDILIRALGSIGENVHYTVSKYSSKTSIEKLPKLTDLKSEQGVFTWTSLNKATGYKIRLFEYVYVSEGNISTNEIAYQEITANSYSLPAACSGLYGISVQPMGQDSAFVIEGERSEIVAIYKMRPPLSVYLQDGMLSFTADILAKGVALNFVNVATGAAFKFDYEITGGSDAYTFTAQPSTYGDYQRYTINSEYALRAYGNNIAVPAGTYKLSLKVLGNTATAQSVLQGMGICVLNSEFKTIQTGGDADDNGIREYVKLPTPNLTYSSKGVMSWSISGSSYVTAGVDPNYLIEISTANRDYQYRTSSNTINFNGESLTIFDEFTNSNATINFNTGVFYVRVQLLTGGSTPYKYITSELSFERRMLVLNSPNLTQKDGVLTWLPSAEASGYKLIIKTSPEQDISEAFIEEVSAYVLEHGLSNYAPGAYFINIQATSGIGQMDVINSKGADYASKYKLDINMGQEVNFTSENGVLKWLMVSSSDYTANKYEIVVDGTNKFVITVYNEETGTITDPNIRVENGYIYYELPENLPIADLGVPLTAGSHTVAIKAIGNDTNTISSNYSLTLSVTKHDAITNVYLTNGEVVWDRVNLGLLNGYDVTVNVTKDSQDLQFTTFVPQTGLTINPKFVLPDNVTINGVNYELSGRLTYSIRIKVVGTSTQDSIYINSNNSAAVNHVRITNITNVDSLDGTLTWSTDGNAAYYLIYYTHTNGTTYTIKVPGNYNSLSLFNEDIDSGKFEIVEGSFTGFAEGNFSVRIRAIGSSVSGGFGYLNSRITNIEAFTKLTPPTNITVNEEDYTQFTWDSAQYANAYEVEVGLYNEEETEIISTSRTVVYTNYFTVSSGQGSYEIKVRTLTGTSKKINSEFCAAVSIVKPADVDISTLKLNKTLNRFEWKAVNGITKYEIRYTFRPAVSVSEVIYSNPESRKAVITISGSDEFVYFQLTEIGIYETVLVFSISALNIASNAVQWSENEIISYNFDIFDSGAGTIASAYKIMTAPQFNNISKFANSNFEQIGELDFAGQTPVQAGSMAVPFGGTYNGNGYGIVGFADLGTGLNKSVFGVINNAQIMNLIISSAAITTTTALSGEVNAAVIAHSGTNSVIKNITVENLVVNISAVSNTEGLNIAAIIAKSTKVQIENCVVKLKVNLNVESSIGAHINVGGIAAVADEGTITACKAELDYTENVLISGRITKAGGIAGEIKLTVIDLVESDVLIKNVNYASGIVAYNYGGKINRAYSYGLIEITGISATTVYGGGLAAYNGAQQSVYGEITNSYSIVNINIFNSATNATINAALLSGHNAGTMSNCFSFTSDSYDGKTVGKINVEGLAGTTNYWALAGTGAGSITNCYYTQEGISGTSDGRGTSAAMNVMLNIDGELTFVNSLNANAGETLFSQVRGTLPVIVWE